LIKRFGRKEGLLSLIAPAILYALVAFCIVYAMWPYFYYVKNETIIVLGLFAAWRYGWLLLNYTRTLAYAYWRFPSLRRRLEELPDNERFPDRIYFVIPSYKEEPWVSVETFQSIFSNLASIPSKATLIVATGQDFDDSVITAAYDAHPVRHKVELVLQRQRDGKRIAMGHALRALARRYREEPNSVTVFMDGDSYLESFTLQRTLPFFAAFPDLGALTTNEIAYVNTRSAWYKDWFNLKFGQRHVLFQSHALSWKVLTLTGRFSVFRTSVVVREDFIEQVENDILTHWMHGKFRFLMGDDKSTWFYLLKHRWKMLYVPDVVTYSLESRDASFFSLSISLPYRWYGNTLRNSARALDLGPKTTGWFIWFAILDQRLSMWTALVGITGALILAVAKSFIYLPFYLAWVLWVRVVQMAMIALRGHPVSMLTIPLMLYNQWVGAVVKIRAYYHLADQKWAKGGAVQSSDQAWRIDHPWARWLPRYLMYLAYGLFGSALLVAEGAVRLPDADVLRGSGGRHRVEARAYGVVPDDGHDDSQALQRLIDRHDGRGKVVIRLPRGRLDFEQGITIRRGGLELRGAGVGATLIQSHLAGTGTAVIALKGSRGAEIGRLAKSLRPDATHLVLERHDLRVDELIWLAAPNDAEFLATIGSRRWNREYPWLRQALAATTRAGRNDVDIATATGLALPDGQTRVFRTRPVRDVVLAGFTLRQTIPGADIRDLDHRYANAWPGYAVDGIRLNWTRDVRVLDVTVEDAGRHPLSIENSYAWEVRRLTVARAWNKGGGGNGYVRIARSYQGLMTDARIDGIRHITLQWSAAGNRLENIDTSVDLNFHGGYAHHNAVRDLRSRVPTAHPWRPVTRTPDDAHWAPPDGPGNRVTGHKVLPSRRHP
jgi:glycosyltransferase Alg8